MLLRRSLVQFNVANGQILDWRLSVGATLYINDYRLSTANSSPRTVNVLHQYQDGSTLELEHQVTVVQGESGLRLASILTMDFSEVVLNDLAVIDEFLGRTQTALTAGRVSGEVISTRCRRFAIELRRANLGRSDDFCDRRRLL
jgi:hypothetical protein